MVQKNSQLIAKARFAFLGAGHYPDATFTLRLSYGQVMGWKEAGEEVGLLHLFRRMGGTYERATGAPPFEAAAELDCGQG